MRPNCVIRLDVNTSRLAVKYMAVTLVQSVAFSCYMTRALLIRLMVKRKLYHATTKRHKHVCEQSRQHTCNVHVRTFRSGGLHSLVHE